MEEQRRVVRAYSEDTERPYYQIRYRLSLTGRELLADALNGNGPTGETGRNKRSESVATTISTIRENDPMLEEEEDGEHKIASSYGRYQRARSLDNPRDNQNIAELNTFQQSMPGTPRSNHRKSQQKQFNQSTTAFNKNEMDMDCDDPLVNNEIEIRRTKSAGTESELHLNRGAPPIPQGNLTSNDHLMNLQEIYPQFASEYRGLVTCLNSKNVRKYRIGQTYRKGIICGIDQDQGKIIVFQKSLPQGTLVLMKSAAPERYEKGYTVQDVRGRVIGSVHAVDRQNGLLVVNTTASTNGMYNNY